MNVHRQLVITLFCVAFLLGCRSSPAPFTKADDAKHAKIGVMTGTTGEAIAKARFPEADLKSFNDIMDGIATIKSGQLDVIVTSYSTALLVSKNNPELGILPEMLSDETSSIALRKGNEELLASLNKLIAELKSDGTLASMKKRWFKPELSPYEELNIAVPTQGTPLRVGVSATREPIDFIDKNGRVTGHDAEFARTIAAKLHRPIEFVDMKFMALIPALQSGKIDVIISGMTATEERKKFIDFSEPYFATSQVMLVRKPAAELSDGRPTMVSPADLKDKNIGVLLGSAEEAWARQTYPNATILPYSSSSDSILALKTGKVHAVLFDEVPLREILRADGSLGVLGDSLFSFPVGAGFNKDSQELRRNFNRFLSEIRKNGVYADMVKRWIEDGVYRMPNIERPRASGELVVGTTMGEAPFGFVRDGEPLGFDVELCKRFGAFLGRDVKFADMQFGGLIAAVATGKVDMIAASIYVTPERQQRIAFSDPYFEMGNRAAALKSEIAAYQTSTQKAASESFFTSLVRSFESNIVQEKRYLLLWDGLKVTVILSICSTLCGTLLGALVCFMRISKRAALNIPAKVYISILRGTPVLVLLMLIFYVVFASVNVNPLIAATIAFGMNFAAYAAELFRSGIEGVDKGQTEAGIAMGFSKSKTFFYIVLPQTIRRILPVYKGEFISLVKMTSIVGYIAVQDLTKASDLIRSRTFDAFFPLILIAMLYFAISWILLQCLQYLERLSDPKYKRRAGQAA